MRILTLVEPGQGRTRTRWKITPPPPRILERCFEGAPILWEVQEASSLLLFVRYRDALLWIDGEGHRSTLFQPESPAGSLAVPASAFGDPAWRPLLEPFAYLEAMVANPDTMEAAQVARAAAAIAAWAGERRYFRTQKAYAELSAYLDASSGEAGRVAGVVCRDRGELGRAEAWFRRAAGISRTAGDWKAYIDTQISWGNLEALRRDPRAARRRFRRAINKAHKHDLRELAGAARHNLVIVATDFGTLDEVLHHAGEALANYGHWSDFIPQLVHDTAYAWAMYGYNQSALTLFDAVTAYITGSTERALLAASVGRACGFLGNKERYSQCLDAAMTYVEADAPRSADILVLMAQGALALGNRRLAVSLARQGIEIAEPLGQYFGMQDGAKVIEAARTRRKGPTNKALRPQDVPLFRRLQARLSKVAVPR